MTVRDLMAGQKDDDKETEEGLRVPVMEPTMMRRLEG
jgi:hypothetical protein